MTGTHAPSTLLTVGDSVREICAVCNRSAGSCTNCVDGYVYRGVYDEQRSGEMREEQYNPVFVTAPMLMQRLRALAAATPNDADLGAAVRAAIKEKAHGR